MHRGRPRRPPRRAPVDVGQGHSHGHELSQGGGAAGTSLRPRMARHPQNHASASLVAVRCFAVPGRRLRGAHGCAGMAHARGLFSIEQVCLGAAMGGHLAILERTLSRTTAVSFPWAKVGARAARGGHVHVLEWSFAHGCRPEYCLCAIAVRFGRFDALRWMFERVPTSPLMRYDLVVQAIRAGGLEILAWLVGRTEQGDPHRCELDGVRAYLEAVQRGHLHVVKWLWSEGVPSTKRSTHGALQQRMTGTVATSCGG